MKLKRQPQDREQEETSLRLPVSMLSLMDRLGVLAIPAGGIRWDGKDHLEVEGGPDMTLVRAAQTGSARTTKMTVAIAANAHLADAKLSTNEVQTLRHMQPG